MGTRHDTGFAIVDGVIRYLSVSATQAGDVETDGGCETRFYFEQVLRKRYPPGKSQALGTRAHSELEAYGITGIDGLGPVARALKRWVPGLPEKVAAGVAHLERVFLPYDCGPRCTHPPAPVGELTAAGVPFFGFIDVQDTSSLHLDSDGVPVDEPGVPEVLDYKTTSDLDYVKPAEAIGATVQMTGYGLVAAAPRVRLSHAIAQTRGAARSIKRSIVVDRATMTRRWERVERLAERLKAVARMASPEEPEKNLDACKAYGGCPHAGYCPKPAVSAAVQFRGLYALTGGAARPTLPTQEEEERDMSLQDKLKALKSKPAATAAPAPVAPEATTPAPAPQTYTQEQLDAAVARRAAELAGAGSPTLVGEAAKAVVPDLPPGAGLAGSGALASKVASTPAEHAAIVAGVLPADAPASGTRERAAEPIPPEVLTTLAPEIQTAAADLEAAHAAAHARTQGEAQVPIATYASPNAPAANITIGDNVTFSTAAPATETTRRGRPKKAAEGSAEPDSGVIISATGAALPLLIIVDNIVTGAALPSLDEYVETTLVRLCSGQGVHDVRVAEGDSILAFGKWKGHLTAAVKQNPPAPGVYTLAVGTDEVRQVIASALRSVGVVAWAVR